MKKTIFDNLKLLALAVILSLGFGVAYAWTGPTGVPPTNNVSGIINTGSVSQIKAGGLWVNSLGTDAGLTIGGNAGVGVTSPTEKLDVNGNAKATAFLYSSDVRLKKNVAPLGNSLDKVLSLEPVSFNWKSDGNSDIGFIAQEVENIFPEVVHTNSETNMKSIDYPKLVVYLVQALKEQQKEIDQLKSR